MARRHKHRSARAIYNKQVRSIAHARHVQKMRRAARHRKSR